MKRSVRLLPLALALLAGSDAYAIELPSFDARWTATAIAAPAFSWAAPPQQAGAAQRLSSAGPEAIARDYVAKLAPLYGLSRGALGTMFVRHVHDTGRGGIIVVFGQRVDDIDVFEEEMKVLMSRQGDIVAASGSLHADATAAARDPRRAFTVVAAQAVTSAFADLTGIKLQRSDLIDTRSEKDGYSHFELARGASSRARDLRFTSPARVKRVFYPMPARIVPAHYVEIDLGEATSTSSDLWGYVIAADTGELLMRRHLTHDLAFNYRVWADTTAPYTPLDGPIADFTPHPTGAPDGSVPPFIPPVLVSIEGLNTNPGGMADPWLAAGATHSAGNNIDAYADLGAPSGFNGATDLRAGTTAAGTFGSTYDTSAAPQASNNQIEAAVTQLFYVTNWLHDAFYDAGFNEAAGNAQVSNFGRGGVEGDVLLAEAQDYSGSNNAGMSTPADGQSPRMQVYLWDGPVASSLTVEPLNISLANRPPKFGPLPFTVTDDLILGVDGDVITATNTDLNDGCEPLTNKANGKIVLLNRGICTFEYKVLMAQTAGAVGVIITNNEPLGLPSMLEDMSINGVNIGSLGITQADGDLLKSQLMTGALTVTMTASAPEPKRDGALDNGGVAHEWGHYLHHRLVACGTDQCAAESEGWGDTIALWMLLREGDDLAGGTYSVSLYSPAAQGDEGYFGLRRFPYSRDFSKNGLTFKHVTNGALLPAGPQQPTGSSNWEIHNAGEVWASMMFQAYTELLIDGGHAFTEAKRRMSDYIVGGMLMAPADPTFTQQRDALLAAARVADMNDALLLAKGFAARGAGTCAVSPIPSSTNGSGVVEDFSSTGQHRILSAKLEEVTTCDADGVLDVTETGKLTVMVLNTGIAPLQDATTITVSSATPGVLFPSGPTATIAAIGVGETATASVDVVLSPTVVAITDADFTVSADNPASCDTNDLTKFKVRAGYDDVLSSSATEDFESSKAPWTKWGAPGYQALAADIWTRIQPAGNNFQFNGQDLPARSDTALESPDLIVDPSKSLVITFSHAFDFEYSSGPSTYWDGGLIEITKDGGMSWEDIKLYASPGYNAILASVAGPGNPLKGRSAYGRRNAAWPGMNTVTLNAGNAFAGKTVRVRFRIGSDGLGGSPTFQGWFIDNIAVQGITNLPFHTIVVDGPGCNKPPSAKAGVDRVVNEGDLVTLDASLSSDVENDPLTYGWTQTAGPSVMLSSSSIVMPTFTAPQVASDTLLTFNVTVDDGIEPSSDSVNVLVLDVPMGIGGAGGLGAGGMGTGGIGVGGVGGIGVGGAGGIGVGGAGGLGVGGFGGIGVGGIGGGSATGGAGGMGTGGANKGGDETGGAGGGAPTDPKDNIDTSSGCDCEAAGTSGSSTGAPFASLLAAGMLLFRRRRNQKLD